MNSDSVSTETYSNNAQKFEDILKSPFDDNKYAKLIRSSIGSKFLLDTLHEIREIVYESGELSNSSFKKLREYFGREEGSITFQCILITDIIESGLSSNQINEESNLSVHDKRKLKKALLHVIDSGLKRIKDIYDMNRERDELHLEARKFSYGVPSRDSVYKFMRYETAIDRQLFRSIQLLEYYQAKRKGAECTRLTANNIVPTVGHQN